MKIYTIHGEEYPGIRKVCIFIFTLSHGQYSVERGFNLKKDYLKNKLDTPTLEALYVCLCYDKLLAQGNNIKSFEIIKELIHCGVVV